MIWVQLGENIEDICYILSAEPSLNLAGKLSEPDVVVCGFSVNVVHAVDLLGFDRLIRLINAELVDPESSPLVW
jgi:hypothetical protein